RRLHGPPVGHRAAEGALPGASPGRGPAPRGRTAGREVMVREEGACRRRGSAPGRPGAERAAAPGGPPRRAAEGAPKDRLGRPTRSTLTPHRRMPDASEVLLHREAVDELHL